MDPDRYQLIVDQLRTLLEDAKAGKIAAIMTIARREQFPGTVHSASRVEVRGAACLGMTRGEIYALAPFASSGVVKMYHDTEGEW